MNEQKLVTIHEKITIQLIRKKPYGRSLYYPKGEIAKTLIKLMRPRSVFLEEDLDVFRELGWELIIKDEY